MKQPGGKKPRAKVGTTVAQPHPFSVFVSKVAGKVGVRISSSRHYATAVEVVIQAAPLYVSCVDGGLLIRGEGVVKAERGVIRVTA